MVNLGNYEDGGRRMYLRRLEMGAATAGARRWLVLAALSSNTMRREQRCWFRRQQRLQHETGAEVAGSGDNRGCSSHICPETDVAGLVPADVAGRRLYVHREEELVFLATCVQGSMELSHFFFSVLVWLGRFFLWFGHGGLFWSMHGVDVVRGLSRNCNFSPAGA